MWKVREKVRQLEFVLAGEAEAAPRDLPAGAVRVLPTPTPPQSRPSSAHPFPTHSRPGSSQSSRKNSVDHTHTLSPIFGRKHQVLHFIPSRVLQCGALQDPPPPLYRPPSPTDRTVTRQTASTVQYRAEQHTTAHQSTVQERALVAALRSATALLPDSPPRLLSVSAAVLPGLTSPPPLEIVAGAAAQKEGSPQLVLHNVQLVLMNHLTTTKVAAKAKKGSLRPYFS